MRQSYLMFDVCHTLKTRWWFQVSNGFFHSNKLEVLQFDHHTPES